MRVEGLGFRVGRQADRQTYRQRDRQTGRQADRQRERERRHRERCARCVKKLKENRHKMERKLFSF